MGLFKRLFGSRTFFRKYVHNKPVEEKIRLFKEKYPDRNAIVPLKDLFAWHHILTRGGCGERDDVLEKHHYDLENGSASINEFIEVAKESYGNDIIKKLEESYNNDKK